MTNNLILIFTPSSYAEERKYVFDVIFNEWLGIEFEHYLEDRDDVLIKVKDSSHEILLPDIFFKCPLDKWRSLDSLPLPVFEILNLKSSLFEGVVDKDLLPILFGDQSKSFFVSNNIISFPMDIFGAIFFSISRYEELVIPDRDAYGRFIGRNSHAYKNKYLFRPLVDEYVEILWLAINYLWPQISRVELQGRLVVTCDVDEPYERWISSPFMLLKGVVGALYNHRSFKKAINRIRNAYHSRNCNYRYDLNWNFDWYMNKCEEYGHIARFYFIAKQGKSYFDPVYAVDEPRIRELICKILSRGHEVGLHASFKSYNDSISYLEEKGLLDQQLGIYKAQPVKYNRQHFLKWDILVTPSYIESAGFVSDSIGFADLPGFRFGTSKQFSMWNWLDCRKMSLKQSPLILMESSIISYMDMGLSTEALVLMLKLRDVSLRYGGDFNLLWHNSTLINDLQRKMFIEIIRN